MEENRIKGDFNPLIVHYRDDKTKRVVKTNSFRCIAHKGVRFYEWPKGSGNLWWENQEPAGRLSDKGEPIQGAAHVEWAPPPTQDEAVASQFKAMEMENKRLMLELSAIKKEQAVDAILEKDQTETSKPAETRVKSK